VRRRVGGVKDVEDGKKRTREGVRETREEKVEWVE
jgi:hypothetical protein